MFLKQVYLKDFKIKLVILFFVFGTYCPVFSQEEVTVNSFLSSINNSEIIENSKETDSLLSDKNYSIPIIKTAQFRMETRRFYETFQEYTIRVKPNSFRAKSSQKYIYQNKIEEVNIANQIKLNDELKKRYLLLIDYIFNKKLIDLNILKQQQLKDKLEILSHSVYDDNFEIKDLIDSEEDLLATNLKLIQLKKNERDHLAYLNRIIKNTDSLYKINFDNLIQPKQILNYKTPDSLPNELLFITLEKLKLNTIDNEMKLSVAKSKQFLDFVQAKYLYKSDNEFEDNLSLGFGINLPFFGSARQEKSEHYFEKLSKEFNLKEEIEKHQIKVIIAKNNYENAIVNFNTLKDQNNNSSVSKVYETYKKMEGVSPLLLLKLKILQNKKEIETLKYEQELYVAFIEYLSINEILFQKPYINYLSSSLEFLIE